MAEEFEVKVLFTGFDDQLLKDWAKETKFAADAMLTVVGTMETQIAALNSIKGELKTIADAFTAGGGGSPGGGGGGSDPHLVSAIRDLSAVIRDNNNVGNGITAAGMGQGGGGSGGRSGLLQDESKSFNPLTLENSRFGLQDWMRQTGRVANWLGTKQAERRGTTYSWTDPTTAKSMRASESDLNQSLDAYANDPNILDPTLASWSEANDVKVDAPNFLQQLGGENQPARWNLHNLSGKAGYFQPGGVANYRSYTAAAQNIGNFITAPGAYATIAGGDQFSYNPFSKSNSGYFGALWDQGKASWFDLNPLESWKTAKGIMQNVAEMGYTGDENGNIMNLVNDLTQSHAGNWDPKTAASYIDKNYRWGYASLDQLRQQMMVDIPKAADSARIGLKEFTTEMLAATEAMTASGARNNQQAAQIQIQGGRYLGMSPGQVASATDNPLATWLGTGYLASQGDKFPLLDASSGPNALYADMKGVGAVVLSALHVQSAGQLRRILKENKDPARAIRQLYDNLALQPGMEPLLQGKNIDQFALQLSMADTNLKTGAEVDALLTGGPGDNNNPLYSFSEREAREKILKSQLNGPNGAQAQRELNRLRGMDASRTAATSLIWAGAEGLGLTGKAASDWAHKTAGDVLRDGHWEAGHTPKEMLTSLQSALSQEKTGETKAVSDANTKLDVSISLDPAFDRLVSKLTYSLDNTPSGTASHSDQRHTYTIRAGGLAPHG